jgi:hypothetical protein
MQWACRGFHLFPHQATCVCFCPSEDPGRQGRLQNYRFPVPKLGLESWLSNGQERT